MWSQVGDDQWRRPDGWLLRAAGRLVEAHPGGDTVHVYAPGSDPAADRTLGTRAVGSPLDGHICITSREVTGLGEMAEDQVWETLRALADVSGST